MSYKIGIAILPLNGIVTVGIRGRMGALSLPSLAIAPSKKVVPLAPKINKIEQVQNAPGTLRFTVELPTANTDGSPLTISELTRLRIFYDTSPGVSTSDRYTDQAPADSFTWAPGVSGLVYARIAVQDSHGNWSALSNEVSEVVPEVTPTEFWAHRLSETSIFSNNTPSYGYVSWSNVKVFFKNIGYTITNGSTNKRYIYWKLSTPNYFQTSDTVPTIGIDDVLIGTNINGMWYLAIYHPQVSAEFLRVGKIQSTNWGSSSGVELDLDAGTFKLGGSSSPKLSWDGSTLGVIGNIVVTGGTIPYGYVTGGPPANADNTATVIGSGLITTGRIELGTSGFTKAGIDGAGTDDSSIRIWAGSTYSGRSTAPFRVTQGGSMVATDGIIGGFTITASALYAGSGSTRIQLQPGVGIWVGADSFSSAPFRVSPSGAVTCSNIQITGGSITGGSVAGHIVGSGINADNITTGTLTGRVIQTAASGPRCIMAPSGGGYSHFLGIYNQSGGFGALVREGYISVGTSAGSISLYAAGSPIYISVVDGSSSSMTSIYAGYIFVRGPDPKIALYDCQTVQGRTALDMYLPIIVNGSTYYLRLHA